MSAIIIAARPELAKYLDDKGHLLARLWKSLYGLRQAGANWFNEFIATILGVGFIQSLADPCVFYMFEDGDPSKICIICIHVDDILRISNSPKIDALLESALQKYGDLAWESKTCDYLGMHLEQQPDYSVKADMTAMTLRIMDKRGVNKPAAYPSVHNLFEQFDPDDIDLFTRLTSIAMGRALQGSVVPRTILGARKKTSTHI